jgi:hypothetical protein
VRDVLTTLNLPEGNIIPGVGNEAFRVSEVGAGSDGHTTYTWEPAKDPDDIHSGNIIIGPNDFVLEAKVLAQDCTWGDDRVATCVVQYPGWGKIETTTAYMNVSSVAMTVGAAAKTTSSSSGKETLNTSRTSTVVPTQTNSGLKAGSKLSAVALVAAVVALAMI